GAVRPGKILLRDHRRGPGGPRQARPGDLPHLLPRPGRLPPPGSGGGGLPQRGPRRSGRGHPHSVGPRPALSPSGGGGPAVPDLPRSVGVAGLPLPHPPPLTATAPPESGGAILHTPNDFVPPAPR